MIKSLSFSVVLFACTASMATAQTFQEDTARVCGERTGEYCYSEEGAGYGSPENCVYAMTPIFCESATYGHEEPEVLFGRARPYGVTRYYDLENYCTGMISCGGRS